MSRQPAFASGAMFLAVLVMVFVCFGQGWKILGFLCLGLLGAVMSETATHNRYKDPDDPPRDGVRPWRRDTE